MALIGWATATSLVSALNAAGVVLLGRTLVPLVKHSITLIAPTIGGLVLLWALGNVLVTCAQAATLALLIARY